MQDAQMRSPKKPLIDRGRHQDRLGGPGQGRRDQGKTSPPDGYQGRFFENLEMIQKSLPKKKLSLVDSDRRQRATDYFRPQNVASGFTNSKACIPRFHGCRQTTSGLRFCAPSPGGSAGRACAAAGPPPLPPYSPEWLTSTVDSVGAVLSLRLVPTLRELKPAKMMRLWLRNLSHLSCAAAL